MTTGVGEPPSEPGPGDRAAAPLALVSARAERYDYVSLLPQVQQALADRHVKNPPPASDDRGDIAEISAHEDFVGAVISALSELPRGRAIGPLERGHVGRDLAAMLRGFGVLTELMQDPSIQDVLVYGNLVVVRRGGRFEVCGRIASGRYFEKLARNICDRANESLDGQKQVGIVALPGGHRLTVMLPPLSVRGPIIAIRKHNTFRDLDLAEVVASGMLSPDGAALLQRVVARGRASVLLVGPPGSGKTTLLNALTKHVPRGVPISVLETVRELQPQTDLVAHLVAPDHRTNPHAALDFLSDAIFSRTPSVLTIVGELVGIEAAAWLKAAANGRPAMATLHGPSPEVGLERLELLCRQGMDGADLLDIRRRIASAVHLVVQTDQDFHSGQFRVAAIAEINGLRADGGYQVTVLQHYDWATQRFSPLADTARFRRRVGLYETVDAPGAPSVDPAPGGGRAEGAGEADPRRVAALLELPPGVDRLGAALAALEAAGFRVHAIAPCAGARAAETDDAARRPRHPAG